MAAFPAGRKVVFCALFSFDMVYVKGGTLDDGMFDFVASSGVPYIMMHIQGTPQTMQKNPVYDNVVADVRRFFTNRIARLNAAGFGTTVLNTVSLMKGAFILRVHDVKEAVEAVKLVGRLK